MNKIKKMLKQLKKEIKKPETINKLLRITILVAILIGSALYFSGMYTVSIATIAKDYNFSEILNFKDVNETWTLFSIIINTRYFYYAWIMVAIYTVYLFREQKTLLIPSFLLLIIWLYNIITAKKFTIFIENLMLVIVIIGLLLLLEIIYLIKSKNLLSKIKDKLKSTKK